MTSSRNRENGTAKGSDAIAQPERQGEPDWADGLRQLYDSVVDEPLPDSFKDLLSKLDDDGEGEQA